MNIWVRRSVIAGAWVALVAGFQLYRIATGLSTTEALDTFVTTARHSRWAVFAYIGLYLIRPLLLVPGTLLTVIGGILFGAWLGIPIVLIAAIGSALVAFAIGVLFIGERSRVEQTAAATTLRARWAQRMRRNAFESILLMRLLFLPYDLVSYTAGMLRLRWQPFVTATAIGIVPGTVAFVLLGASLSNISEGVGGIDWRVLTASGVLFVASVALSRMVKARTAVTEPR